MVKPLDLYRMIYSISDEINKKWSHALNFTRICQWRKQVRDDDTVAVVCTAIAVFLYSSYVNERDGRHREEKKPLTTKTSILAIILLYWSYLFINYDLWTLSHRGQWTKLRILIFIAHNWVRILSNNKTAATATVWNRIVWIPWLNATAVATFYPG